MFGVFSLRDPIPFDGTIVTVTASGYCSNTKDGLKLQMILLVGTPSEDVKHPILVNCTEVSYGDSNVTSIGRVETNESIAVRRGHYLGILYVQCGHNETNSCTFLPAVDNSVVQQFVFVQDVKLSQIFGTKRMTFGLQFSFTIERGETLYMHHKY